MVNYTHMKKHKNIHNTFKRLYTRHVSLIILIVLAASSFGGYSLVYAATLQEQIDELNGQNSQNQANLDKLEVEASSYQDAISILQSQINEFQKQIDANAAESQRLQTEMDLAQKELDKQKSLLGESIKAMYVEGDMTTIEMLATSNDLGDFFDKQQYRDAVKDKIKLALDKVTALKAELKDKKAEKDRIVIEQQALRATAAAQKTEQDRLLGFNQSQQDDYNSQIKNNQDKIAELRRQQAIENARLFGGGEGSVGGGGYPWGNAPCLATGVVDGSCWGFEWGYNGTWNNWATGGYAYRNCTDWVAWRIKTVQGISVAGLGNAKQWPGRAGSYGYTTGRTPQVGAAAISMAGTYGHVMYVEAVNGDGSAVISDYNRNGTGKYLMSTISAASAANLYYVYF